VPAPWRVRPPPCAQREAGMDASAAQAARGQAQARSRQ
jgi:hypothetical protein